MLKIEKAKVVGAKPLECQSQNGFFWQCSNVTDAGTATGEEGSDWSKVTP